jgi:hypothetical protein
LYSHEFVLVGIELLVVLKLLVERGKLRITLDDCAVGASGRDGAGVIVAVAVAVAVENFGSMDTTFQASEGVKTVME